MVRQSDSRGTSRESKIIKSKLCPKILKWDEYCNLVVWMWSLYSLRSIWRRCLQLCIDCSLPRNNPSTSKSLQGFKNHLYICWFAFHIYLNVNIRVYIFIELDVFIIPLAQKPNHSTIIWLALISLSLNWYLKAHYQSTGIS